MSNAETFANNQFVVVRNLLDPYLVQFLASYFHNAEGHAEARFERDWTSLNAHSDACGDAILYATRSAIEANTGMELLPTYSFVRMYRKGDTVGRHKDGKENQVSCTICIERDTEWPLGVSDGKEDFYVDMNPGDAVIYQGFALDHWRNKYEGERQVQLIVGYVQKGGKHEEHRFYGRGEPIYTPWGVKRESVLQLAKGRAVKLRDKIMGRDRAL